MMRTHTDTCAIPGSMASVASLNSAGTWKRKKAICRSKDHHKGHTLSMDGHVVRSVHASHATSGARAEGALAAKADDLSGDNSALEELTDDAPYGA